jgi:hypothetical protein
MILLPLLLVSTSPAQIGSANSSGSAHSVSTAPPTGSIAPPTGSIAPPTSAAFIHNGNVTFNSGLTHSSSFPHSPSDAHGISEHHHRHYSANGTAYYPYYPYAYALPVPYAVDANDSGSDDDDSAYQGGPTIFDRRGSGRDSYIAPSYEGPAHARSSHTDQGQQDEPSAASTTASTQTDDAASDSPKAPTILVFKDGHQLEVDNYAILSQTLFDLTPGHSRKIALADLDLPATQKQNDDKGVDFQLPPSAQAN